MKNHPWWTSASLFLLGGITVFLRAVDGDGVLLPPTTLWGRWYLFALPTIATAILVIASKKINRFDFLDCILFEFFLMLWFAASEIITSGGLAFYELPVYYAIIFLSVPAIVACALSGIIYWLFIRK